MSDTVTEAVRQRLLRQNLNWWKGNKRRLSQDNINQLRNEFNIEYRDENKRFYNLRAQTQKSPLKVGMLSRCDNCIRKNVKCSGPTNPVMRMCAQCAVDNLKPEECVYSSLDLNLPAWARSGGGDALIQPAQAGAGGAGLAIRIPQNVGRGSPTGMVNEENENDNNNGVNSNASRDPNATEEQIAAGRAKKQARRNKVARNVAASALVNLAAGAGAGGKRSRTNKRKNLKRKQKQTRKQKQ